MANIDGGDLLDCAFIISSNESLMIDIEERYNIMVASLN